MDVRRLAIFLEVVDQGGFTRAADALDIAQPSVSQAVRELEDDLGTPLFHRLARSVALTPAGEALVLSARQVRRDMENGRLAVQEVAGLGRGRLDLACLPTLAVAPLAPLVGAFRAAYPQVSIVLSDPQDTAELVEFVRSGRSEVGLVEHVAVDDLVNVALGPGLPGRPATRDQGDEPIPAAPVGRHAARRRPVGQLDTAACSTMPYELWGPVPMWSSRRPSAKRCCPSSPRARGPGCSRVPWPNWPVLLVVSWSSPNQPCRGPWRSCTALAISPRRPNASSSSPAALRACNGETYGELAIRAPLPERPWRALPEIRAAPAVSAPRQVLRWAA